ncbi:MAG: hypothetical protein ACRDMV_21030 [Streptosporangiales bacterium]
MAVIEPGATPTAAVTQAIGAASMCWEHVHRAGQFRSDEARQIVDELCAYLGFPDSTVSEQQ